MHMMRKLSNFQEF